MQCSEFLEVYSDYRDGTIPDPDVRAAVEAHLCECLRCRRLARAMTRGLALLHLTAEEVEPSAEFRTRLECRLRAQVTVGDPVIPTHAGLAAALLLAAALGLLVVEGLGRSDPPLVAGQSQPSFEAALANVTLPAFAHSTLEFHGVHAPLGSYALFTGRH
jgi:anti-sigma factor RsiW